MSKFPPPITEGLPPSQTQAEQAEEKKIREKAVMIASLLGEKSHGPGGDRLAFQDDSGLTILCRGKALDDPRESRMERVTIWALETTVFDWEREDGLLQYQPGGWEAVFRRCSVEAARRLVGRL